MNTITLPKKNNLEKMMRESARAVSVVVKNIEVIETMLSIQEIKSGKYKKFLSGQEMFKAFGI